jgi:hypothetical protein
VVELARGARLPFTVSTVDGPCMVRLNFAHCASLGPHVSTCEANPQAPVISRLRHPPPRPYRRSKDANTSAAGRPRATDAPATKLDIFHEDDAVISDDTLGPGGSPGGEEFRWDVASPRCSTQT